MAEDTCSLKSNEQRVLKLLIENKDYSFRELAKITGLNEVSVRRLHNKLKQENVFYTLNVPNFPALGYKIMMLQLMWISSHHLIETRNIVKQVMDEWWNCLDCYETYDSRIVVRSIWKNAEDFKKAHAEFYKKHGTDWLDKEHIDMIPLDESSRFLRINELKL